MLSWSFILFYHFTTILIRFHGHISAYYSPEDVIEHLTFYDVSTGLIVYLIIVYSIMFIIILVGVIYQSTTNKVGGTLYRWKEEYEDIRWKWWRQRVEKEEKIKNDIKEWLKKWFKK